MNPPPLPKKGKWERWYDLRKYKWVLRRTR